MGAGTKFRKILARNGLVEAMASHSPLSAMLAAEAGFGFGEMECDHVADACRFR